MLCSGEHFCIFNLDGLMALAFCCSGIDQSVSLGHFENMTRNNRQVGVTSYQMACTACIGTHTHTHTHTHTLPLGSLQVIVGLL